MKQKRFKSILAFLLVLCMAFGMQANLVFAQTKDVANDTANVTGATDTTDTANDTDITTDDTKAAMSGSCGATEKDNVTWELEQNNQDNSNPTYTLKISGTGAMANLNTSTEIENSTSGNSSYPWSKHSSNITKIIIGDGVTSIGSKAFIGYKNVTSVEIGKDVSEIGVAALSQLSACTEFDVSGNSSFTTDKTGVLFDREKTKLIVFPCASSVTEYEVPGTVKTIAYGAFSRAENLQTITIPANSQLETVGYGAFAFTTALKTVNRIPASMMNIGDLPFSASGVKHIYCADAETKALVQGKVGGLLVDVLLLNETPAAEFTENGYDYWLDDGEAVIVSAPKTEQIPTVPSSVTYNSKTYPVTDIWRGAFAISTDWNEANGSSDKRNETITSVTLPASITQIGERAFYFCKNLSEITIQASEVTIDNLAFATQNSNGTTLDFSAVTKLNITGENAWNGVSKVILNNKDQLDTIKSSVKTNTIAVVGNNEWKKDSDGTWVSQPKTNLTAKVDDITWTFDVLDGEATLTGYEPKTTNSVTVPSAVTVDNDTYTVVGLGKGLFGWSGDWNSQAHYNTSIESVVLPDTISTIGADMFRYSTNLKSVTIQGKNIVFNKGRTFSGATMLKMLDISSVESVDFEDDGTDFFASIDGTIIYVSSNAVKNALTTHGADSSKIVFAVTNGGTVVNSDSSNTELNNNLKKANYKFLDWYDNEECTGTAVTTIGAGKIYYANWEAKTESTISFRDSLELDKTYDGNPVSLSEADCTVTGDNREVTFSYQRQEDGDTWEDIDIVTAPIKNAGTYRVKATVAEDETYASAETDWKEFTISKADPTYTAPTDLTAVAGQTLADVTLPEGFAWEDSTTSVGSAGTHKFKATYTPKDKDNFNTANIEITLTVKQKPTPPVVKADYSKVDAAIEKANALTKDNYKDFSKVEVAIAAVVRDKNSSAQAEVDAMAKAIEDAIAALTYKDADYSKVDEAIEKVNALNKDDYTDFSAVEAAIAAVDRDKNITQQAEVDAMAKAIEDAIGALEAAPAPAPAETVTKADIAAGTMALNKKIKAAWNSNNLAVSWGKVSKADGYEVYAAKCGDKYTKVKTVKGNKTLNYTVKKIKGKKLDPKRSYKVCVKAYRIIDGKKNYTGTSYGIHTVGPKNKTYTNAKSVKASKKSVTLKKGKNQKVSVKITKQTVKKKLLKSSHVANLRYFSTNAKVATVTKSGTIKAAGKGSCTVYALAANGVKTTVKVTVK